MAKEVGLTHHEDGIEIIFESADYANRAIVYVAWELYRERMSKQHPKLWGSPSMPPTMRQGFTTPCRGPE